MKKWSKEAKDIDMGWKRTDGFTYGVRVKQEIQRHPLWLNHMKRGLEL